MFRLFEAGVDDGTYEGIKAVIALAATGLGVERRVGGGVPELGFETLLPVGAFVFVVEFGIGLFARLFPTEVVLEFFALGRRLFEVARMTDSIGFGSTFVNDCATLIAIALATVDNAVRRECAFDVLDGMLIVYFCHKFTN